jgi:PAS domain S-box-containing protein
LAEESSSGHSNHAVQFYESDDFLAATVSAFIGDGIDAGEGGIVIGTRKHREAIEGRLNNRQEFANAKAKGLFISLDATETLSQLMVGDLPDPQRFEQTIGGLVRNTANGENRRVRAFGEMVALLWAEGKQEAALRLEELWNELGRTHSFSLLCGYPMSHFGCSASGQVFESVCEAHSHVFPTESSGCEEEPGKDWLREVALLEQKARSLEAEIADRKHIERLLRESEARLQGMIDEQARGGGSRRHLAAIVESSDDAIISKNLNGVIMSWNAGAERIFGYTADEIIGRSVTVLIPPELQHEEPGILARLRRGERIDHYHTIRRRKDGSIVNVSLTVSPVRDASGKIVAASKIARDITQQKEEETRQRVLFELATTVNRAVALPEIYEAALTAICRTQSCNRASILLCDAEGVMRFRAWRGLSDEYRRAVEGHSPWKRDDSAPKAVCVDDVSKAELDEHLRAVVAREAIRALAFLPITYEGRLLGKFMIYYDAPHHFTPEELQPTQTIINQVAFAIERQKAGEVLERTVNERTASLREAIVQMEEFSYSVSHDLRAPVRAMQCYAEVLREDYGDRLDENAKKYLERIINGGIRMDRLIQDILTYSRLSRREMELKPIPLDKVMREIVRQYLDMRPSKADVQVEGKLLSVLGHEPSLNQAISNLLHNALKFVAPGTTPKVRIHSERRNGDVRLWIEDNGIGIRPEYQHRLFSVFERIHPEKNYEGTGIGLAIVRKAAERMGGKAGVESDGVNGSRFWLQLPAAPIT